MAVLYLPKGSTGRQCAGRDLDVIEGNPKWAAPVLLKSLPETVNRLHGIPVVDSPAAEIPQSEDVRVRTRRAPGLNEVDVVDYEWPQSYVQKIGLSCGEADSDSAIHNRGILTLLHLLSMKRLLRNLSLSSERIRFFENSQVVNDILL